MRGWGWGEGGKGGGWGGGGGGGAGRGGEGGGGGEKRAGRGEEGGGGGGGGGGGLLRATFCILSRHRRWSHLTTRLVMPTLTISPSAERWLRAASSHRTGLTNRMQ